MDAYVFLMQINGKLKIPFDPVLRWEGCDASAPGVAKCTDASAQTHLCDPATLKPQAL